MQDFWALRPCLMAPLPEHAEGSVMRVALIAALAIAAPLHNAGANGVDVQLQNGDVYLSTVSGMHRLTRDGQVFEVTQSRDGKLIAFIHKDGSQASEEIDTVVLCVVSTATCRKVVSSVSADDPKNNLTGINSLQFSYQAGLGSSGELVGSVFFLTNGWATSGAVHRATLGASPLVTFVVDANGFKVVPDGKFAGALAVERHTYAKTGAGSCDQNSIMDPNTGKRLALLPSPECQGLAVQ